MTETAPPMRDLLVKLTQTPLPREEMEQCFDLILEGQATPTQIASFMTALAVRGETPQDIAAGASALRARAVTIKAPQNTIDIVGTGGDGSRTWNISTTTALVVAGAGIPVAKHGNKAISSMSGAADVLSALGLDPNPDLKNVQAALDNTNICFLMAPRHHSAMRHVAPVRAEMGFRSIFNMLGPLSNPALVKRIMVGVFDRKWIMPFAQALRDLGATHALVVHGSDGLDEVTTTGETAGALLKDGTITEITLHPSDIGIEIARPETLVGGNASENAQALRACLGGAAGAYRDIVILNAAAALLGSGHAASLKDGAAIAIDSIDSGKATKTLESLISITNNGKADG